MPAGAPPLDATPDQVVVATGHVAAVTAALEAIGAPAGRTEDAPELGLTLVDLERVQVDALGGLDAVLQALYARFDEQYGWVPTIGKNRVLERVIAHHKVGGGDEGDPVVVAASTWPSGAVGAGVRVAVGDTGIVPAPVLAGRFLAGEGSLLATAPEDLDAAAGHATFVAGLVLREAPGADLRVHRVLGDDGTADSWTVAREIVRLGRTGVDVLNLSLGCFTDDGRPPLVLATAVDRLPPHVLVVAAAGNHAEQFPKRPMWPAALDDVVAVGAVDSDGQSAPFSPDPALNPWVDVLAPGVDLLSTYLSGAVRTSGGEAEFDGFARWSGTSFAAALVTGRIAAAVGEHESPADAYRRLVAGAPTRAGVAWLG
ncbi:subtilase family protein [Motilibacter rhizosphaerae]|uniref:Subtilase family protein n=1 Tax=Motilibacter rhizosphaerae TaxID=598652 RepID=A0A4Q7NV64_9ACTN|nr:S8 family serine peptidase [Motilibacter rhizosphaerae]RZS91045.1 subtilase family protein [Motilibacter rhizosphaerae]